MRPFETHVGIAVPLRRSDVDTDQLIPARFVVGVERTGYADALMHDWRVDPSFVLNDPRFADGSILIAGPDFGTGSSRESAVWALLNYGFRTVIAPRFGDIFRGNATNNGLLAAVAREADIRALWDSIDAAPEVPTTVDLRSLRVNRLDLDVAIDVSDTDRWRLLNGLDDIELTLRQEHRIDAFEAQRRGSLPTTSRQRVRR